METIIKGSTKAVKTKGLHQWTENETIVSFYLTKYGTKFLYLKTESEVAKNMGVSLGSLKMQMCNLNFLLGGKNNTLTDYSELQREVFEKYNGMSQLEFCRTVKNIIGQDSHERKIALSKLGKDISKMKSI